MKIVYIAHPIGGDVKNNLRKIIAIVRDINLKHNDIMPMAHHVVDCLALNDDIPEERERGLLNGKEILCKGVCDELWLYGNKVSQGMIDEINIFTGQRRPIVPKTKETQKYCDKNLTYYQGYIKEDLDGKISETADHSRGLADVEYSVY